MSDNAYDWSHIGRLEGSGLFILGLSKDGELVIQDHVVMELFDGSIKLSSKRIPGYMIVSPETTLSAHRGPSVRLYPLLKALAESRD